MWKYVAILYLCILFHTNYMNRFKFTCFLTGMLVASLSLQAREDKEPFAIGASFTGDAVRNFYGGMRTGNSYLGLATVEVAFDIEKAGWCKGNGFYFPGNVEIIKNLYILTQFGFSPKHINCHNHYYSLGVKKNGLFRNRPDIQFIMNPAGTESKQPDAWVGFLRFGIEL